MAFPLEHQDMGVGYGLKYTDGRRDTNIYFVSTQGNLGLQSSLFMMLDNPMSRHVFCPSDSRVEFQHRLRALCGEVT